MSEFEPAVQEATEPAAVRCELAFCRDLPERLEPGELYVMAADRNQPEAWVRSQYLVENSLAAFQKGEGDVRRVVVPLDPTLDDMLAATFCAWLLAGRKLPAGRREVRAVRGDGARRPAPLQAAAGSHAGRRVHGHPQYFGRGPVRPETAARFVADWWRMSDRIMPAAAEGLDPRTVTLFDDLEFSREQTYLADDHKVFLNDLAHGEILDRRSARRHAERAGRAVAATQESAVQIFLPFGCERAGLAGVRVHGGSMGAGRMGLFHRPGQTPFARRAARSLAASRAGPRCPACKERSVVRRCTVSTLAGFLTQGPQHPGR